jgi:FtsP/CotA-like multicopper oxidase with cupredoxin domain
MRTIWWASLVLLLAFLAPARAATRRYYITAEDVTWDFAPSGLNLTEGRPIPAPWAAQTKWQKTRYFEYTDSTFKVRKPQPEWLGILGPIIRAEVGDEIIVEFLNRSRSTHSIHPHGVRYDKDSEGAYYVPAGRGSLVPTNGRFTYHWFADAGSGPGPGQLSSVVWWYHPHSAGPMEINAGLMGPIIITAKGKAKPDGSPKDVDREFVTSFQIFDELRGKDPGMFHAINGYVFGNLPGLVMKKGEKVRWHLMGMGNEKDMHTPHWHGKTVMDASRHMDVVELLPASTYTVDMLADNPGVWMYHCHVADHMEAGMMSTFTIYDPPARSCPVRLDSGNFWNTTGKYSVTVKNSSGKPIKQLMLESEHFLAPQYLHHPFDANWPVAGPISAGGEQTVQKDAYIQGGEKIQGWALFPRKILFEDGTTWEPKQHGECFQVYWREKEHPDLIVLPPAQGDTSQED